MEDKKNEHNSYIQLNTVLDKMLEIKKAENKVSFGKKCFLITSCIASIILLAMLCVMFYKNSFSIESLISLLLAFFSIFISVFFYFKADEASNRFYKTSYDFMKDVSVTLGKIEERFGEKLNSLNDKVSHLSAEKAEKKEELESAEDEKQKIIDDLLQKSEMSEHEKDEYRKKLNKQDQQISALQFELARMRHIEPASDINVDDTFVSAILDKLTRKDINIIRHLPPKEWPVSLKDKLYKLDMLDTDGLPTMLGLDFFKHIL